MQAKILIVDDNKSVLTALEMLLSTEFESVMTLKNPSSLLNTIQSNNIDVVLLDMNFKAGINNGNEGIFWFNEIKKLDSTVEVIMITAHGDVELAVRTVKEGAFDFILKPWDNNKLMSTVHAAVRLRKTTLENRALLKSSQTLKSELNANVQPLIGKSSAMNQVMELVRKVAATDANVLITGENGTGKELIAREIHRLSRRSSEIMLSVDMGAVSETLFESELFGHVKGAFTDARDERTGKIEAANKGTLFLDEIGNLSLSMQAKMLVALQNRTVTKLGSNVVIPVDIRLITATNKNLHDMIARREFREDLLYRINTITIDIPPLRQRGTDILLLAHYFVEKFANKYGKSCRKITTDAEQCLLKYPWPGNVRELQHTMEKAVILSDGNELSSDSFMLETCHSQSITVTDSLTIDEMEKNMIVASMKKEDGNLTAVAKNLGITRQTLYNKMKKYGL
jgi:DNA-binding NtrC family response regulator